MYTWKTIFKHTRTHKRNTLVTEWARNIFMWLFMNSRLNKVPFIFIPQCFRNGTWTYDRVVANVSVDVIVSIVAILAFRVEYLSPTFLFPLRIAVLRAHIYSHSNGYSIMQWKHSFNREKKGDTHTDGNFPIEIEVYMSIYVFYWVNYKMRDRQVWKM